MAARSNMTLDRLKTSKPIWISHRGVKTNAVENTMRSFQDAVDAGFTHVETDLRSTVDGQIVLAHDADLSRLTGQGVEIDKCSAETLRSVRLPDGQSLLFFDEFMAHFGHLAITFDVKPESGERTLVSLAKWLKGRKDADQLLRRCRFLFWRDEQRALWLSEFPRAVCLAGESECLKAGLAMAFRLPIPRAVTPGVTYALLLSFKGIRTMRPSVVARYHQRGARVLAYLPSNKLEVEASLAAGVDEILTDGLMVAPRG